MERIAEFYKVSFEQYKNDFLSLFPKATEGEILDIYEKIKLPERATSGSAGYDFYSPIDVSIAPEETVNLPTGIRVKMENGWVLALFPRSGLGFKFRLQLNNTVGIIDSDYFSSKNEGHIFIKMTNASNENKTVSLKAGDGFAQGIFLAFGITYNDNCEARRDGGFGSTDKR